MTVGILWAIALATTQVIAVLWFQRRERAKAWDEGFCAGLAHARDLLVSHASGEDGPSMPPNPHAHH